MTLLYIFFGSNVFCYNLQIVFIKWFFSNSLNKVSVWTSHNKTYTIFFDSSYFMSRFVWFYIGHNLRFFMSRFICCFTSRFVGFFICQYFVLSFICQNFVWSSVNILFDPPTVKIFKFFTWQNICLIHLTSLIILLLTHSYNTIIPCFLWSI